jgi:uncharacterized protein (UPF0212 family)
MSGELIWRQGQNIDSAISAYIKRLEDEVLTNEFVCQEECDCNHCPECGDSIKHDHYCELGLLCAEIKKKRGIK